MARFYARVSALAIVPVAGLLAANAQTATQICGIVPHFKDEYRLSVGYGPERAAEAEGAQIIIHESGGYHSLDRQIALLDACVAAGSDAIVLGAVSVDAPAHIAAVAAAKARLPVLAVVNELDAPGLAAWGGIGWREMGAAVGRFLTDLARTDGPLEAVVVTGPDTSGWGPILDEGLAGGLAEGLAEGPVEIVATYRADTGTRAQLREVERALAEHPDINVVVGSAPAIEGTMALPRRLPADVPRPRLVATCVSHSVLRGLKNSQLDMVPFDDPIAQGRTGLLRALRAATGDRSPGLSGPGIRAVVGRTDDVDGIQLSPSGYFPEIE